MFLRAFGLKPKGVPAHTKAKMPSEHGLVDLIVTGGGPRGSVTFEALHDRSFTVQALPGMHAGQTGVFSYETGAGKFRFSARCSAIHGHHAVFALPQRIDTLQARGRSGTQQQRAAVRLAATIPAQWRFAFAGKGQGEFVRASLTDISRTGASLICERELKRGGQAELRFAISTMERPLQVLAEVMRATKIEVSGKYSLGLRFAGLSAEEDRAIMEFINKRQAERRSRGLA